MLPTEDTISAIVTPQFPSGIGIIRISGRDSISIAGKVFRSSKPLTEYETHKAVFGTFSDPQKNTDIDEGLCLIMKGPNSYTGEDVVEFNLHGSPILLREALGVISREGARLAEPGEFTFRAYMNGKMSLTQSEAVNDLILARSEAGMRNAFLQMKGSLQDRFIYLRNNIFEVLSNFEADIEFPEEGLNTITRHEALERLDSARAELVELADSYSLGRKIEEGIRIVICGPPNSGKSTLLNSLLNKDRALVHDTPGTTRDIIEDFIEINGAMIRLVDTAGIRDDAEEIEEQGIRKTYQSIKDADLVLLVQSVDFSEDEAKILYKHITGLITGSKSEGIVTRIYSKGDILDPGRKQELSDSIGKTGLLISAKEDWGISELEEVFSRTFETLNPADADGRIITSLRQKQLIESCSALILRAIEGTERKTPLEYIAVDLNEVLDSLDQLTGLKPTDDVYDLIFSRFCVGK